MKIVITLKFELSVAYLCVYLQLQSKFLDR